MPSKLTVSTVIRTLTAALCVACLTTAVALAADDPAPEAFGIAGPPRAKLAAKPAPEALSQQLGVDVSRAPQTSLSRVDVERLRAQDAIADRAAVKVVRYGVGREVELTTRDGDWTDLEDGRRLWIAELTSPEAIGLRVHFRDVLLPAGARLAIYAADLRGFDAAKNPVEIHGGPLGDDRRHDFWTGSMPGERVRIEYLATKESAGQSGGNDVPFAVDRLQHLYRDPLQVVKSLAGSCEHDVACHPEYQQLSEAIAGLGTIGVDALFCTGTLVNTQVNDHTPLFLTANHCHVQDFPAATEVYWNYQTASCGGEAPSIFDVKRSSHLTLVSTNTYSDYTLLMIDGSLPSSELYWAGWTSATIATGVTAVAIHHPRGDVKKISFANVDRELDCASYFPGRSVVPVGWTDGVTEPGSSGSGIFRTDTNQLFGQLFGGPSACGEVPANLYDCYGAFATTYQRISKPLKNGTDDKLEPNDGCKQARVLRNGKAKGLVLRAGDQDWYRVQVPAHKSASFKLAFTNANGDLDIAAYDTCPGKSPLAVAATSADGENLLVKNSGTKPAWIYVNVYFGDEDTRANYDLTVSQK